MSKPTTTSHFRKPMANLVSSISACSEYVRLTNGIAEGFRALRMGSVFQVTSRISGKTFVHGSLWSSRTAYRSMYDITTILADIVDEETMVDSDFIPNNLHNRDQVIITHHDTKMLLPS